jgi:hypothetical protein
MGSIRETVLSTSFVTHSDPAATATPAGCFPTLTVTETMSGDGAAPATDTVVAKSANAAAIILVIGAPCVRGLHGADHGQCESADEATNAASFRLISPPSVVYIVGVRLPRRHELDAAGADGVAAAAVSAHHVDRPGAKDGQTAHESLLSGGWVR